MDWWRKLVARHRLVSELAGYETDDRLRVESLILLARLRASRSIQSSRAVLEGILREDGLRLAPEEHALVQIHLVVVNANLGRADDVRAAMDAASSVASGGCLSPMTSAMVKASRAYALTNLFGEHETAVRTTSALCNDSQIPVETRILNMGIASTALGRTRSTRASRSIGDEGGGVVPSSLDRLLPNGQPGDYCTGCRRRRRSSARSHSPQ